jgi:ATP-dependent Clp protease ATP-binding subunit ClpA
MTSNVGSTTISMGRRTIGFSTQNDTKETTYAAMKLVVMEELKAFFRPELLNRMDEVVVFRPLEKAQVCCFYTYCTLLYLYSVVLNYPMALKPSCYRHIADVGYSQYNAARSQGQAFSTWDWLTVIRVNVKLDFSARI